MSGVTVACDSCGRRFVLPVAGSPHLVLELQSRPCPYCEAYTLSCREIADIDHPPVSARDAAFTPARRMRTIHPPGEGRGTEERDG